MLYVFLIIYPACVDLVAKQRGSNVTAVAAEVGMADADSRWTRSTTTNARGVKLAVYRALASDSILIHWQLKMPSYSRCHSYRLHRP